MHADDIAAHIIARVPHMAAWPAGRVAAWWTWHWRQGFAGVLREQGRIVAIGAARATDREHVDDDYHHDPAGDMIYIALAIAEHEAARLSLWRILRVRIGMRPSVGYHRAGQRLCVFPFERFDNLLNKQNYGFTLSTSST